MTIHIISQNPYRTLGVLSNSPLKERVGNQNRLAAFAKVGKEVTFPNDFASIITDKPVRTPEGIAAANTAINLDKDQLKYALFWFICGSSIDDIALKHLQAGNREKAEEIFQKKETYSSLINTGVLAFIDGNTATGFNNISKVIHDSTYRAELLQALDLANLQLSEDGLAELVIAELLKGIPASKLLSACTNATDRAIVSKNALDEPITEINSAIAVAKSADSKNPEASLAAGTKLMNSTKAPLKAVKDIAGASSPQYQMVADNVAKQVLQCGINYYNNAPDSDVESPHKAMALQSYALSIAVGQLTKDRCKENYDILKGVIDKLPPKEIEEYVVKIDSLLRELRNNFDKYVVLALQHKIMLYCGIIKGIIGEDAKYYSILENKIVQESLNSAIEFLNNLSTTQPPQSMSDIYNRYESLDYLYNFTRNLEEFNMSPEISSWYKSNLDIITEIISKIPELVINRERRNFIQTEKEYYNKCTTIDDYNIYLEVYSKGIYYEDAKRRIADIQQKEREKKDAEIRGQNQLRNKIQTLITIEECIECKSSRYLTEELRHLLDDKAFFCVKNGNERSLMKYEENFDWHRSEVESLLFHLRQEKERMNSIGCWIAVYAIVGLILYLIIG